MAVLDDVPLCRIARTASHSEATTTACCSKSLTQNVEVSEATNDIDWIER